ncbi:PQQ-like beta-propeller repeat protein, partial [bacterium]|nr:PQQ-like beta-propeller repeat protein [bacterium]
MKILKKWILRILILALIGIAIFAIVKREMLGLLITGGDLSGKTALIPAVKKNLTKIEKGEHDWLSWRGKDSRGLCYTTGIIKDWSSGLKKIWEVDYLCKGKGTAAWSSPVIKGNRLIVCGRIDHQDYVFCLGPETGELIWKTSYEAKTKKGWGSGSRATPFIDGDRIYTFGRSGELACLQLFDGKILWKTSVETIGGKTPSWGHASSPLVMDNKVIIQCGGKIRSAAFDKMTGKLIWSSGKGVAGYAAITFMEINGKKVILEFHGKGFSGLDPENGKEFWNLEWKTQHDVNATTPVPSGDKVFVTSGYGRGSALIKVDDKNTRIEWENGGMASHHSDPYIIDGFIYGYSGQSM